MDIRACDDVCDDICDQNDDGNGGVCVDVPKLNVCFFAAVYKNTRGGSIK